jgi:hypothetical protein
MGHGVGIWDGSWDHYEEQQETTTGQPWTLDGLEEKLKQALGDYVDGGGSGVLRALLITPLMSLLVLTLQKLLSAGQEKPSQNTVTMKLVQRAD